MQHRTREGSTICVDCGAYVPDELDDPCRPVYVEHRQTYTEQVDIDLDIIYVKRWRGSVVVQIGKESVGLDLTQALDIARSILTASQDATRWVAQQPAEV